LQGCFSCRPADRNEKTAPATARPAGLVMTGGATGKMTAVLLIKRPDSSDGIAAGRNSGREPETA
jgi:hypothetical protein